MRFEDPQNDVVCELEIDPGAGGFLTSLFSWGRRKQVRAVHFLNRALRL